MSGRSLRYSVNFCGPLRGKMLRDAKSLKREALKLEGLPPSPTSLHIKLRRVERLRRGYKTAEQVGPNVVATGSGAIDLTVLCLANTSGAFQKPLGPLRIIASRYCVVKVLSVPYLVPTVLVATIRK
jgi:hypothetical protein